MVYEVIRKLSQRRFRLPCGKGRGVRYQRIQLLSDPQQFSFQMCICTSNRPSPELNDANFETFPGLCEILSNRRSALYCGIELTCWKSNQILHSQRETKLLSWTFHSRSYHPRAPRARFMSFTKSLLPRGSLTRPQRVQDFDTLLLLVTRSSTHTIKTHFQSQFRSLHNSRSNSTAYLGSLPSDAWRNTVAM